MIEIIANAKVNFFLEITGKLPNGYHTVDTVMQSVSLADRVRVDLIPQAAGIIITSDCPSIPCDERNIAYKTAKAYLDATEADFGVRIEIEKNIPSEAGLGGGSADGAAVVYAINHLCGAPLETDELCRIVASRGADIPFCIYGGTARLGSIGTDLIESYSSPELNLVIVKPPVGISTPGAYRILDGLHNNFTDHQPLVPDIHSMLSCGHGFYNRFEETLGELCPESKALINELSSLSHAVLLSGSGTAAFAVADNAMHADRLVNYIKENHPAYFATRAKTVTQGCIKV